MPLSSGEREQIRREIRSWFERLRPRETVTGRYAYNLAPELKPQNGGIIIVPGDPPRVDFQKVGRYDATGNQVVDHQPRTINFFRTHTNTSTRVWDITGGGEVIEIKEEGLLVLEMHVTVGMEDDPPPAEPGYEFSIYIEDDVSDENWNEYRGSRAYGGASSSDVTAVYSDGFDEGFL